MDVMTGIATVTGDLTEWDDENPPKDPKGPFEDVGGGWLIYRWYLYRRAYIRAEFLRHWKSEGQKFGWGTAGYTKDPPRYSTIHFKTGQRNSKGNLVGDELMTGNKAIGLVNRHRKNFMFNNQDKKNCDVLGDLAADQEEKAQEAAEERILQANRPGETKTDRKARIRLAHQTRIHESIDRIRDGDEWTAWELCEWTTLSRDGIVTELKPFALPHSDGRTYKGDSVFSYSIDGRIKTGLHGMVQEIRLPRRTRRNRHGHKVWALKDVPKTDQAPETSESAGFQPPATAVPQSPADTPPAATLIFTPTVPISAPAVQHSVKIGTDTTAENIIAILEGKAPVERGVIVDKIRAWMASRVK